MNKVRYGITGFGRFAEKAIAPAIQQSHNSELVAIQNRSLAKAKRAAAALGVNLAFDSVPQMLSRSDIDAVFIVSPNSTHCTETILAAKAGKHVLCEKPMAMNVSECMQMMDFCSRHDVKFMVGHMTRFSPLVQRMRELVRSGAIGKIIYAKSDFVYDGRPSSRTWLLQRQVAGGGPTFDVGVHCLDTLRFILGDEVASLQAILKPLPDEHQTETSSQLLLQFSRGTIATVFSSYEAPIRESCVEIIGTEARISTLDFTVGGKKSELIIEKRNQESSPFVIVEEIEVPNLYVAEVEAFSSSILENSEPPLAVSDALMNQKVLDEVFS